MKVVYFLHFTKEPNRYQEWRRLVDQVSGQNFHLHSCPWPLLLIRVHCHITSLWFQESLRAGSGGGAGWTLSRYLGFTDQRRMDWWHIYPIGLLPNLDVSLPGWRTLSPEFVSLFWLLTMHINKRLGCFIQGTSLRGTKIGRKGQGEKPSHP